MERLGAMLTTQSYASYSELRVVQSGFCVCVGGEGVKLGWHRHGGWGEGLILVLWGFCW